MARFSTLLSLVVAAASVQGALAAPQRSPYGGCGPWWTRAGRECLSSLLASTEPTSSPVVEVPTPSTTVTIPTETPAPKPSSTTVSESVTIPVETPEPKPETPKPEPPVETTPAPAPAPSTTKTTSTPAPTTTSTGGSGNADQDAYLAAHNNVRRNHGAVDLTWSDELAAAAQTWANNCQWKHSQGAVGKFGENLAGGTNLGIAAAVKLWTDEVVDYDPANPQYSHFTQVVWKGTTQVGCAVQTCNGLFGGSTPVKYYVCEYNPPGNVIGRFAENVEV